MNKFIFFLLSILLSVNIFPFVHDLNSFATIPIMHEGRVKPISTFAKIRFEAISGKTQLKDLNYLEWFAELIFNPESSYTREVFKIDNNDVKNILKLPNDRKLFTFIELYAAFSTQKDLLSKLEMENESNLDLSSKQVKKIFTNFSEILSLSRSLSMFNKNLNRKIFAFSYYDLLKQNKKMTKEELLFAEIIKEDAQFKTLLIIPPSTSKEKWTSPWGEIENNNLESLKQWQNIYNDYNNDGKKFEYSSIQLNNPSYLQKFKAENIINKINLVSYSITLLVFSAFLLFTYQFRNNLFLYKTSLFALASSFLTISIFIATRCFVLSRPPVSNLYESIIFVAATAILFSLIYELKFKNQVGIFIGSILSTTLLFLSIGYKQTGDNLSMVVAVLDTNFWLATHVLTISIGYGTTLVSSLLAHVYLFKLNEQKNNKFFNNLYGLILISFLFTCLGTILGGIWADQSWGRFWGWDPKENGALLICLWLIFITHGKIGRIFSNLLFATLAALSSCIVIIAWFGVNLLNVGLHSYGFSNDTAIAISIFCLVEITIALYLYFRARKLLM